MYSLSSLTITGFGPTTTTIAFTVYNTGYSTSGLLVQFGAPQKISGCSLYPTSQPSFGLSSIPISSTLVFEMQSWQVTTDLGATAVDQLFATSKVLYRLCPTCTSTHQQIFYQRLTSIPASFSIYSNLINTWTSTNNILNTDFKLFGSYSDYSNQQNAWQVCNYDNLAGFPRDCGPT
eukprot:gene46833-63451_t